MQRNAQSLRNKTILIVGGSVIGFFTIMHLFARVLWQAFDYFLKGTRLDSLGCRLGLYEQSQ